MTCQSCKHWELQKTALKKDGMAQMGFATCAHGRTETTYSANHTCPRLEVMAPELIEARVAWFKKVDSRLAPLKETSK